MLSPEHHRELSLGIQSDIFPEIHTNEQTIVSFVLPVDFSSKIPIDAHTEVHVLVETKADIYKPGTLIHTMVHIIPSNLASHLPPIPLIR